jgi:hypothetical protein
VLLRLTNTFTLLRSDHRLAEPRRSSAKWSRWLRWAWALALVAGGVWACFSAAGVEQWRRAWLDSLRLGAPLAVLLALPAVSHFVKSLGWRGLLPASIRPGIGRAYVTFVAAQAVNELGFSVLGEPLKVLVLPPSARGAAVRAVAADNVLAFAALLVVLLTFGCCRSAGALAWLALGAVGLGGLGWRFSALLAGFAAHYLGKLWLALELGLGLYFLDQPALAACAPLASAWLGASALGAAVPGQLGVVEAALLHAGGALGIATPSLLTLALIRRLRATLWMSLGLLLAARIVSRLPKEVCHVSTSPA